MAKAQLCIGSMTFPLGCENAPDWRPYYSPDKVKVSGDIGNLSIIQVAAIVDGVRREFPDPPSNLKTLVVERVQRLDHGVNVTFKVRRPDQGEAHNTNEPYSRSYQI